MLNGLFVVAIIVSVIECIKQKLEPEVPLENWANKDLYYEDMMNGVPMKQITKNLQNGKYKLDKE